MELLTISPQSVTLIGIAVVFVIFVAYQIGKCVGGDEYDNC